MPRRLVDLSIAIDNDTPADPPPMRPAINYRDHAAGAQDIVGMFAGLKAEDLPDGEGWAIEEMRITTITARISMRRGTIIRPWMAASAPSPSMKCRWTGATAPV